MKPVKLPRTKSTNFLTNIITLILIFFGATGVTTTLDPEMTVTSFLTKNWEYILTTALPSFIQMVVKVYEKIKAKDWDWSLVKRSWNFWTQAITVVMGLLTLIFTQITFPENAAVEIVETLKNGTILSFVSALLLNFINPIIHFFRDKDSDNNDDEGTLVGVIQPT